MEVQVKECVRYGSTAERVVGRTLTYLVREQLASKKDNWGSSPRSIEEKIRALTEMMGRMCDVLANKGLLSMNDFEEIIGTGQHGIVEWGP